MHRALSIISIANGQDSDCNDNLINRTRNRSIHSTGRRIVNYINKKKIQQCMSLEHWRENSSQMHWNKAIDTDIEILIKQEINRTVYGSAHTNSTKNITSPSQKLVNFWPNCRTKCHTKLSLCKISAPNVRWIPDGRVEPSSFTCDLTPKTLLSFSNSVNNKCDNWSCRLMKFAQNCTNCWL